MSTFIISEKWTGNPDAFDDVVFKVEAFEIAPGVETKKSVLARSWRRAGNDVIVAEGKVGVWGIHPDDAPPGVVDEIIMKIGRALCRDVPKFRDEIATILLRVKIEEVVVNCRAIAHVFDGVSVLEIVVVNVEGRATCRDRSASVLGDGDGTVADVVVDLYVLVVFKGELDREIGFDGVMMYTDSLCLPAFDALVVEVGLRLCIEKTVVEDLAVLEPEGEDASIGDPAFDAGPSFFPTLAGIGEDAVVNLELAGIV